MTNPLSIGTNCSYGILYLLFVWSGRHRDLSALPFHDDLALGPSVYD